MNYILYKNKYSYIIKAKLWLWHLFLKLLNWSFAVKFDFDKSKKLISEYFFQSDLVSKEIFWPVSKIYSTLNNRKFMTITFDYENLLTLINTLWIEMTS